MDYLTFIQKLDKLYDLSNEMLEAYKLALYDEKKDYTEYWQKFCKEWWSSEVPPMPSFWKDMKTNNQKTWWRE